MEPRARAILVVFLTACGGGAGASRPGVPVPDAGPAPSPDAPGATAASLVTPAGAEKGEAVTETIAASGGRVDEPMSGASVVLAAGSFDGDAIVTLTPVENLVPGGLGDALAIDLESGGPQRRGVAVQLAYGVDVSDPAAIHLAMQREDGAWLALPAPAVDAAARTLSVTLPAASGAAKPRPRAAAASRRRVIARWLDKFFLDPPSARVTVGQTESFTAYATGQPPDPPCADGEEDCLASLPVPVPFTNDKPGYIRIWQVNGVLEGDGTVGTVHPNGAVGAVYTAPAKKPSPSTVVVEFISTDQHTTREASAMASVTIVDDCDLGGTGGPECDWVGQLHIEIEGVTSDSENTTQPTCGYHTNCQHMMMYEHKITADVTVAFRGAVTGGTAGELPVTSASGSYSETLDRVTHDQSTSPQGCVYTDDDAVHESAAGPAAPDEVALVFLNVADGSRYLFGIAGVSAHYTGAEHEQRRSFDCINGEIDLASDRDIDTSFPFIFNVSAMIDPKDPSLLTGTDVQDLTIGDIDAKVRLTWTIMRP